MVAIVGSCGGTPSTSSNGFPLPIPTPMPSPSPAMSVSVPDGLDRFAWARTRVDSDADGNVVATEVSIGWLGSTATLTERIDRPRGFARTFVRGEVAAVVTYREGQATIELRKPDGSSLGRIDVVAPIGSPDDVLLDPARSQLYAAVRLPAGGVDIRRLSFDGATATTLLRLDERFAVDGIPTERYGFALAPDGSVEILACAKRDGCRLWRVGADEDAATGGPRTLAPETPIVCSVVGATLDWLVVTDDQACTADTGDAPLPLRAISLRDGSSQLLANDHVIVGRVMEVGGRAIVAASLRSDDWSTSEIITIDVESARRGTVLRNLKNSEDDAGWLGASPFPLVGDWLLIGPWGGSLTSLVEPPNARLLNLSSGRVIELPPRTFGQD
jgi:hypothetical protein